MESILQRTLERLESSFSPTNEQRIRRGYGSALNLDPETIELLSATSLTREDFERAASLLWRQNIEEQIGRSMERRFQEMVLGHPPRAEELVRTVDSLRVMAQASTLTTGSIQRAVEVMSRSGFQIKDHRFRDCELIQRKHPKMKLGEIDRKLKEWGHEPELDHEESKIMPGMSKGVAGYIMLNDKLKVMLDRLCDLNTWKPDV